MSPHKCLICQKNDANITIEANYTFSVCGESNCLSPKGENIGQWLLSDGEHSGHYHYIEGCKFIILHIGHKKYKIINDKRVIKGLHNKIRELALKQIGIKTDHQD